MCEQFMNFYLSALSERDALEKQSAVAQMIKDQRKNGIQHIVTEEIEDKRSQEELKIALKQSEQELQAKTSQMTKLTEQNISLMNQLSDTKEMLFEAEQSIQSMNSYVQKAAREQGKEHVKNLDIEKLEHALKIERDHSELMKQEVAQLRDRISKYVSENQSLSTKLQLTETKLQKSEKEKDLYIDQLIQVKSQQADILDQSNKISEDAQKMKLFYEDKLKNMPKSAFNAFGGMNQKIDTESKEFQLSQKNQEKADLLNHESFKSAFQKKQTKSQKTASEILERCQSIQINKSDMLFQSDELSGGGEVDPYAAIETNPNSNSLYKSSRTVSSTMISTSPLSNMVDYGESSTSSQKKRKVDEVPCGVMMKRKAHDKGCFALAFDNGYGNLATGGGDGYVRLWDANRANAEPVQQRISGSRSISALGFNQIGQMLACAGSDLEITLLRTGTTLQTQMRTLQGHQDTITSLQFMSTSAKLFSASMDRTVRLWNLTKQKEEAKVSQQSQIMAMDCSQDSVFVTGHKSGDIKVWSTSQMKNMQTIQNVHQDKVECVKVSPNGREIISLGRDNVIKFTDYYTYKEIASIEHRELYISAAGCQFSISPNGKYLAVGNAGGSLLIFDIKSRSLEEIYQEHPTVIVSAQWDFSNKLATADTWGNVYFWE